MILLRCIAAVLAAGAVAGEPTSVFDLEGEKSPRVVVTTGPESPPEDPRDGMLGELHGVLATLDRAGYTKLRACEESGAPGAAPADDAASVCYVHIVGDAHAKVFEIARDMAGGYIAVERGGDAAGPGLARLKGDQFDQLSAEWSLYRGPFDAGAVKEQRGVTFRVNEPYYPGRFRLDGAMVTERMGGKWTTPGSLELGDEVLVARLPKGYDPRMPAALLVWLGPSAAIGDQLAASLDKHGIIAIGCGADVEAMGAVDRCQLGLDAAATAQRRWHVDTRLVYIGGFSEGAASAMTLGVCFPDVFTGTLAIGGFSCYRPMPTGQGSTSWPADFARARGGLFDLFLQHPVTLIAGTADFNYGRIMAGARVLKDDGARVAEHEYEGLGHEMPTAKQFERYLNFWHLSGRVPDERRKAEQLSGKAWDLYTSKYCAPDPKDPQQRRMLEKVIEAGPWSETAWRAVETLEGR